MKKPEFSLKGKTALVTGAGGGIGSAIAELFGSAGAELFLTATKEHKLKALSDKLSGQGVTNNYLAIDIRKSGAPEELMESVLHASGRIDILVNSAGINRPQKPEDVTEKNWDDVMDINVRSLFFISQAAGKEMIKQKSGKIINISSQAGIVALPLRSAYCSSKGAVNQLTRTMAYEWAPHNVTVNAVAPTFVETPFVREMFKDPDFKKYVLDSIPMGRMATVEETAYAALYLACDFANIITGHVLVVDGGWTIK